MAIFGIQWVMPLKVIDVFLCWKDSFGWHSNEIKWVGGKKPDSV